MFKLASLILVIAVSGCALLVPPPIGGEDEVADADGDGFNADVDCDDTNPAVHAGAVEVCDGFDNNCDGVIDPSGTCPTGDSVACYGDGDFDGSFGGTPTIVAGQTCPAGLSPTATDCNDGNGAIRPGATEQCNNIDDDCDGQVDDSATSQSWYRDADGDTFGTALDSRAGCSAPAGYVADDTDCDDSSAQARPNRTDEDCGDGVDNDCDGFVDSDDPQCPNGSMSRWYFDGDADGYGDIGTYQDSTTRPYPANRWLLIDSDCDDEDVAVNPGAYERCENSVDDDCDGVVNEGCPTGPVCTPTGAEICGNGVDEDCNASTTDVCSPTCTPTGVEICGNTVDEDCSGVANACPGDPTPTGVVWYFDYDGDGYGGTQQVTQVTSPGSKWTTQGGDCDDESAWSNPSEREGCDGEDNDCDGQIDEGVADNDLPTWYRDADGDTFGNSAVTQRVCVRPQGYVSNRTDCDDTTSSRRPGAVELCNGIDDDCDGTATDEPATCSTTPSPPTQPVLRDLTVCVDVCHGGTCGPWIPTVVSRAQFWVKNTTRGTGSWYAMNAITIDWNRAGNLEASACGQIRVATGDQVILNGFVLNTNTNRWEHFVGPNDTDTTARFGRPYFPGGGDDRDFIVASHSYRNGTDGDAIGKAFVATVDAVDSN